MGLDLKHLKATQVQEVRWLMPSEKQVLYNTQTWVHKIETRKKPLLTKKCTPH